MNENIVYHCRKIVALWDVFDDLHSMRIHNVENIKAITDDMEFHCRELKKELSNEFGGF